MCDKVSLFFLTSVSLMEIVFIIIYIYYIYYISLVVRSVLAFKCRVPLELRFNFSKKKKTSNRFVTPVRHSCICALRKFRGKQEKKKKKRNSRKKNESAEEKKRVERRGRDERATGSWLDGKQAFPVSGNDILTNLFPSGEAIERSSRARWISMNEKSRRGRSQSVSWRVVSYRVWLRSASLTFLKEDARVGARFSSAFVTRCGFNRWLWPAALRDFHGIVTIVSGAHGNDRVARARRVILRG